MKELKLLLGFSVVDEPEYVTESSQEEMNVAYDGSTVTTALFFLLHQVIVLSRWRWYSLFTVYAYLWCRYKFRTKRIIRLRFL